MTVERGLEGERGEGEGEREGGRKREGERGTHLVELLGQ